MDEITKTFSLRTVLTVITGRILTEPTSEGGAGLHALYDLLDWMLMERPSTPQLGRFMDEARPRLLRLFPELALAAASAKSLDSWLSAAPTCPDEGVKMWVAELKMLFPQIKDEYAIPQFPFDHQVKDSRIELAEKAPNMEILEVSGPRAEAAGEEWPREL